MIRKISLSDVRNIDLAKMWDKHATPRIAAINDGIDKSLIQITTPYILRKADMIAQRTSVIDIGCGVGYTTYKLAEKFRIAVGCDISHESINEARQNYHSPNLHYLNFSIKDMKTHSNCLFDMAVLNMVMSSVPDIASLLRDTKLVLNSNATVIITLPHPFFFSQYWDLCEVEEYDYAVEQSWLVPFMLGNHHRIGESLFISRPVSLYVDAIYKSGYEITAFDEFGEIVSRSDKNMIYPKFLGICLANKNSESRDIDSKTSQDTDNLVINSK